MSHHTRGRKAEPKPIADAVKKVPTAPKDWPHAAKKEWKRIMPVLVERRVLYVADLHAVERFCEAAADIVAARGAIEEHGAYITNRLGELKRNPAYATLREATAESRRWAAELGLTPAARSRAGIHEDDDDNPLDL
jgi:P27 family predicted phage terminase small subunit